MAAALAALVPLLVLGALRFNTSTKVSTAASPAAQPSSTLPSPPAPRHPAGAVQPQLATGTASDGRPWVLFFGGPSGGVCLGIEIGDGGIRSDTCAGQPGPAAPDPYRPLFHNDIRTRPFVFGRVADDIVAVAVEESATDAREPMPVIRGSEGSFYAVELPHRKKPGAVTGFRNDGTSVRYPVP